MNLNISSPLKITPNKKRKRERTLLKKLFVFNSLKPKVKKMDLKQLEITLNSAKGLKRVKHLHAMNVYAVVTISSNPQTEQRTPVDKGGGTNPMWNYTMKFTIDEAVAKMNYLFLNIKLMCHSSFRSDKEIGEVLVPVKELLDKAEEPNLVKYMRNQVRKPSGKPKGELNFSFKFEDMTITAYPPRVSTSSPYPPPLYIPPRNPPQSGYSQPTVGHHVQGGGPKPPPPPPPDGYPTPPPGMGYYYHERPQVVQPQQPGKNNDRIGLDLGIAFVGGMLGGMLMGELVSDDDAASTSNDAAQHMPTDN